MTDDFITIFMTILIFNAISITFSVRRDIRKARVFS
jgi:hypothetical protein